MFWNKIKKRRTPGTLPPNVGTEEQLEKLLPSEILPLLKIKKYSQLAVGAQQYFDSAIMDINTEGFGKYARSRSADQIFAYINRMLAKLIPVIRENGGIAESFHEGGMTVLFPEKPEKSLNAAVTACDDIHKMEKNDPQYREVSIGICFGSVMAGVVGHEKRLTVLTLSESKDFAGFLRLLGSRYGAKIIVSSNYMKCLGALEKTYNYRILGRIYIRSSQKTERVYDVYDGDCVEVRNLKRKTKMVFEKGVALFEENQVLQARLHFIEVLKMDHADRAAREYLLRCDRDRNSKEEENWYLEIY